MKTINVDHITKIEGHAKLHIRIENNKIEKAELEIFEGARFFEAILKGKRYDEAGTIVSRICGFCSHAHLVAALLAVEDAFGVQISEQTRKLRELLILGATIQNSALHTYFLALPDYLGFPGAIAMASKHPDKIRRALKLKKLGNDLCTVIGGREIHSLTPVVGGFSYYPTQDKLSEILVRLKEAKKDARETAKLFAELKYPGFVSRTEFFCLQDKMNYSLLTGEVASNKGKHFPGKKYREHFSEYLVQGSSAKFVATEGHAYLTGPLARVNINSKYLSKDALAALNYALKKQKTKLPCYSPYFANVCRTIELIHFIDRAIELLEELEIKNEKPVEFKPKEGTGVGVLEAPRGVLFHEYSIGKDGRIKSANIIPPTTQNLRQIEEDIKKFLPTVLNKTEEEIKFEVEKLIRSYDPCISCSTHFLEIKWERK